MSKWQWYLNDKGEVISELDGEEEDYAGLTAHDYANDDASINYSCQHSWVNVGFHHLTLACKYCGIDAPTGAKEGD